MDKEFVVAVTELYRKFKEKDRSVLLFRHYLALLALRYLYDTRHQPDGLIAEQDMPKQLITLFQNSLPPTVAPLLDSVIRQLLERKTEALKGVLGDIAFTKWIGKDQSNARSNRLGWLMEELGSLTFGSSPATIRSNGSSMGYLIEKYAEENFHKKGFLYTPKSIATLLVRLINPTKDQTLFDPASGLGNLLVQAAKWARVPGTSLVGAETDENYWQLSQYNLFFNGLSAATVMLKDSLTEARKTKRETEAFDCVLLHPPFGDYAILPTQTEELHQLLNGTAKSKVRRSKGAVGAEDDFLSLLLRSLKSTGKAAMIVPHGVLFKTGHAYHVRRMLLDHNVIEAVVDLPPNIFYSCKVNVAILVFNKAKSHSDILFIDASRHYEPDRRRNKMRAHHIEELAQLYQHFTSVNGLAYKASIAELQADHNDYNLTAKRYIQQHEHSFATRDLCNLREEVDVLTTQLNNVHDQLAQRIKALTQMV